MAILLGILSLFVSGLTAWALFHLFFEDMEDFGEAFRYSLTPDFVSLLRGEWMEDYWQSMKLGIFLLLVLGAGFLTWMGLSQIGQTQKAERQAVVQVNSLE